jgi:pilus assembly protein Flp/PilA
VRGSPPTVKAARCARPRESGARRPFCVRGCYMNVLHLLREEGGATAVEYAVMLAMILMAVVGAIGAVGAETGGMWGGIVTCLTAVGFFH